ncbi:MAG: hypothetical protein H7A24_10260 [Leptospiraceae bacterium]|nr:hypothetical protein [Leptospiraceae bacterium]MCP5512253.1 hypothetical protein [Leptospiraceae bacterium]
MSEEKPVNKIRIRQDTIIALLREHAEMVRLLEAFPKEVEALGAWIQKKNTLMDKVTRKIPRN